MPPPPPPPLVLLPPPSSSSPPSFPPLPLFFLRSLICSKSITPPSTLTSSYNHTLATPPPPSRSRPLIPSYFPRLLISSHSHPVWPRPLIPHAHLSSTLSLLQGHTHSFLPIPSVRPCNFHCPLPLIPTLPRLSTHRGNAHLSSPPTWQSPLVPTLHAHSTSSSQPHPLDHFFTITPTRSVLHNRSHSCSLPIHVNALSSQYPPPGTLSALSIPLMHTVTPI